MNRISLYTHKREDNAYLVEYRIGKKQAAIEVEMSDRRTPYPRASAELAALRHLLVEKKVFGENRRITVVFSDREAYQASTDFKSVFVGGYEKFMFIRYWNAIAELGTDFGWVGDSVSPALYLRVDRPEVEKVFSPLLGWLSVTVHAVEKVVKEHPNAKDPFKLLVKSLGSLKMEKVVLPTRLVRSKRAKYVRSVPGGEVGVLYRNPRNGMVFQVTDGVLVTTFIRADRYMEGAQSIPLFRGYAVAC